MDPALTQKLQFVVPEDYMLSLREHVTFISGSDNYLFTGFSSTLPTPCLSHCPLSLTNNSSVL